MKWLRKLTIFITFSLMASGALADGLKGFWKNNDQAAWIEVQVDNGQWVGIVRRNDAKPEAVGRILLKDIAALESPNKWSGQIYAQRLSEFKDAEISLPESNRMEIVVKVGFMSRTVEWTRVDVIPDFIE